MNIFPGNTNNLKIEGGNILQKNFQTQSRKEVQEKAKGWLGKKKDKMNVDAKTENTVGKTLIFFQSIIFLFDTQHGKTKPVRDVLRSTQQN